MLYFIPCMLTDFSLNFLRVKIALKNPTLSVCCSNLILCLSSEEHKMKFVECSGCACPYKKLLGTEVVKLQNLHLKVG